MKSANWHLVTVFASTCLLSAPFLAGQVSKDDRSNIPEIVVDPTAHKVSDSLVPKFEPHPSCGGNYRWFERPMTVPELAGGWVKNIRIVRFSSELSHTSAVEEMRNLVKRVWPGKFQGASCQIDWDEGTFWSVEAVVDFYDGRKSTLLTDGSHVELEDHNGNRWFLRLLPTSQ